MANEERSPAEFLAQVQVAVDPLIQPLQEAARQLAEQCEITVPEANRFCIEALAEKLGLRQSDEWIRAGEAAHLLGVSPKTVARWADEGKVRHSVTLGGHRIYSLRAIQDVARRMGLRGESSSPEP